MNTKIQSWLLSVEPFAGESLSHFLGRFRRQNHLSPSALGDLAGVGAVIARWERFHLNPFPSEAESVAIAQVVGVTAVSSLLLQLSKNEKEISRQLPAITIDFIK